MLIRYAVYLVAPKLAPSQALPAPPRRQRCKQPHKSTPAVISHAGVVRAQKARPPPRPRATATSSSTYENRKKGDFLSSVLALRSGAVPANASLPAGDAWKGKALSARVTHTGMLVTSDRRSQRQPRPSRQHGELALCILLVAWHRRAGTVAGPHVVPSWPACSGKSSHLGPSRMRSLSKVNVSLRCAHARQAVRQAGNGARTRAVRACTPCCGACQAHGSPPACKPSQGLAG